jgi:uncharacterized membrane protein YvlD (DUF360 family)
MGRILRVVARFVAVAFIEALSLLAIAWLIPGIRFDTAEYGALTVAMAAALVLAFLNGLVRPFLVLLTLPFNALTLGLPTLLINAGMLLLVSWFLPAFVVEGWLAALLGTLILAVVNTVLTSLTTIDDDYAFFEGAVRWLATRQKVDPALGPGRGLVMLEFDGLSYSRIKRAVERGMMPTVQKMLRDGTHALSPFDCGVPSQTSACQAGIMFGDNHDIPAFRWFDKEAGKMYVSNDFRDAAALNARYANGRGLLRGGSSINNLLAGDASKALLTMCVLADGFDDFQKQSREDMYLFLVSPYVLTRSIVLTLWDLIVELFQGQRQRLRNVQPRINRLHKGYPILRAITNVFLRDLGTFAVAADVMRGAPAIYTTYVGYDEVAHHAGPDSPDAMDTLKSLDTQTRRVLQVIQRHARRLYDIVLLSDHGQSVGATFEQRYGQTLAEFIEGLVEEGVTVSGVNATNPGQGHTAALLAELQGVEQNLPLGRGRSATLGRARKTLERRLDEDGAPAAMESQVIVCASGNLANVYFNLHAGKIGIQELHEAYPGLLDALVGHPGVGFVIGYDGAGVPWVLANGGTRNLGTGAVEGSDPLAPYGDPEHRAAQLLRLARFPHAGDLIVNSTLYEDGQVAAFEELVGSHGGLGGQQTQAFILHPADMQVPQTRNATDLFALLDARRGLPGEPLRPRRVEKPDPWARDNLSAGVRDTRSWVPRALRALRAQRSVFREVAEDIRATGPALVILLAVLALSGLADGLSAETAGTFLANVFGGIVLGFVVWLVVALLGHVAGTTLGGHGDFARTMRALAFAMMPQLIGFFEFLPGVGPLFGAAAMLWWLYATWVALQEALGLRRFVAALVPPVALFLVVIASLAISALFGGLELTLETLLMRLGLSPG